ncbi:MAG: hypothetical protein SGJ10_02630 [Bacteroidota bacterium]|nr:hypothetical protein [Bacteroidota bacterium]
MKKVLYILFIQLFLITYSKAQLFEMNYGYSMNLYKGEYNTSSKFKGSQHSVGGLFTTPKNAFGASIGFGVLGGQNQDNTSMPTVANFKNKYQEIALVDEYHLIKFHPAMMGSSFTPVIILSAGVQKLNVSDNWISINPDIQKANTGYNYWFVTGVGFKMALGRFIFRSNYSYYISSSNYLDGVDINKKHDGISKINIGLGYMFSAGSDCTQKRLTGNYFQWGDKF